MLTLLGGVPEWPKGTGCKPVGSAFRGSNPLSPITDSFGPRRVRYVPIRPASRFSQGLRTPPGLRSPERCGTRQRPLRHGFESQPPRDSRLRQRRARRASRCLARRGYSLVATAPGRLRRSGGQQLGARVEGCSPSHAPGRSSNSRVHATPRARRCASRGCGHGPQSRPRLQAELAGLDLLAGENPRRYY